MSQMMEKYKTIDLNVDYRNNILLQHMHIMQTNYLKGYFTQKIVFCH